MRRLLRLVVTALAFFTAVLSVLIGAALLNATGRWLALFNDGVTLPNGMILKREFDFSRYGRDDLFAADGRTPLARDIEFVCFNDRYVDVYSYNKEHGGLYDGVTGGRVLAGDWEEYRSIERASGLLGGHGCNGYYTGVLGPNLLYDEAEWPHLPPCAWRNLDNPTLADRSWFDRPCFDWWPGWPQARPQNSRSR